MRELKKTLAETLDQLEDELAQIAGDIEQKKDDIAIANAELQQLQLDKQRKQLDISHVEQSLRLVSGKRIRNDGR